MTGSTRSQTRVVVLAALAVSVALLLPPAIASADQIAYGCDNDLCIVDPDSGSPTNLTQTAGVTEREPAWSPDGTKLAFTGNLPGAGWELYQLTVANPTIATNVSQTNDRTEGGAPIQWSPGGERIAYTAIYDSNAPPNLGYDVFVSPAAGTAAPTPIGSTSAQENYGRWSPDGTQIAFARRQAGAGGIFIGNADGSGTPVALPNGGGGIQPDWSRDGTRIAFVADGGTDLIRVARVDGSGTPVTLGDTTGLNVQGPFFSPDGTRVMWQTQQTIYIRNADGTGTTTTVTHPGLVGYSSSWSPDGTRIAFSAYESTYNKIQIWVANADGTGTPRSITPDGLTNVDPQWKPDPNAQPPVDPPVVPTRPPVTVSLAKFHKLYITGGPIPYVPIAYVICDYPTAAALAAGCKFHADGTVSSPGKSSPGHRAAAKKKIKFGSGSLDLGFGEEGELRLKVSKAGKKLLKPGRKLKIKVKIEQRVGDDPVVETTKTLKLKVPKKKGKGK
ncbi:MAG: hypothetical protein M9964_02610 [Solirubrobacterales bacterium]|nr:PD40 domain-containing protein [Thermoleophilales bacterium]MCO5325936.1 hypothetical protein [Solirubrobacterales bacterium]